MFGLLSADHDPWGCRARKIATTRVVITRFILLTPSLHAGSKARLLSPSLALPMLEPEVNASSALSGNSEKWSPRLVGGLDSGEPGKLRRRRGRRHLARADLVFQFLEMARCALAAFE